MRIEESIRKSREFITKAKSGQTIRHHEIQEAYEFIMKQTYVHSNCNECIKEKIRIMNNLLNDIEHKYELEQEALAVQYEKDVEAENKQDALNYLLDVKDINAYIKFNETMNRHYVSFETLDILREELNDEDYNEIYENIEKRLELLNKELKKIESKPKNKTKKNVTNRTNKAS